MLTNLRQVLEQMLVVLKKAAAVLDESLAVLRLTRILARNLVWGLTVRPRGFGVRVQESEEMGQLFTYKQGLLAVPAGVASQRLAVTVDGVSQEPVTIAADATDVEFKAGPVGASVTLSLDYLDSSGNDSANVETTFVVVDGIPPEAPAGFGEIAQIAEENVDESPLE